MEVDAFLAGVVGDPLESAVVLLLLASSELLDCGGRRGEGLAGELVVAVLGRAANAFISHGATGFAGSDRF